MACRVLCASGVLLGCILHPTRSWHKSKVSTPGVPAAFLDPTDASSSGYVPFAAKRRYGRPPEGSSLRAPRGHARQRPHVHSSCFFFHAPLKLAAETARQSELSFPHDKARLSTAGDDLRSEPDTRRSRDDATMHSGTGKHARPAASCASRGDGLPEERRPCHLDRGVPLSFGVRGSEGRGPCLRGQGR